MPCMSGSVLSFNFNSCGHSSLAIYVCISFSFFHLKNIVFHCIMIGFLLIWCCYSLQNQHEESKEGGECSAEEGGCLLWRHCDFALYGSL